jgi:hypothetical protein
MIGQLSLTFFVVGLPLVALRSAACERHSRNHESGFGAGSAKIALHSPHVYCGERRSPCIKQPDTATNGSYQDDEARCTGAPASHESRCAPQQSPVESFPQSDKCLPPGESEKWESSPSLSGRESKSKAASTTAIILRPRVGKFFQSPNWALGGRAAAAE